MSISNISSNQCTGCCACMNICVKDAIQITIDEEGFYKPQINSKKCVNCGICYSKCPANNKNDSAVSEMGYLIRLKDSKLLKKSASGGAFIGIARHMIKKYNAVVIGAAITDKLVVRHIVIESLDELKKLQNSKYVQSYTGDIYENVLLKLNEGRKVVFSGTPCQIAGVYTVVPENRRSNLLTIDLVCHGVPSPALLKRQLEIDSLSGQGSVVDFQFRYKNPRAESNSSYMMMMMMMMRGLPIVRRTSQDVYFNLFMKGMDFRESCYECQYANLKRIGDITVGDCDSRQYYPNFHPNESNSIVLLNTEKGRKIWQDVMELFDYTELDVCKEAQFNHQLDHPFERPIERTGIYNELLNNDWTEIKEKYVVPQGKFDRYKLLILLNIPEWVKKLITLGRKNNGE